MLHFESDYVNGAHPKILERLQETNLEGIGGYGGDAYCAAAKKKILEACGFSGDTCGNPPRPSVHFLTGGTQTNAIAIKTILRPWEGVIAADTGHIAAHEAGAIEAGGHKVLTVPHVDGKVTAEAVEHLCQSFYGDANHEHMVKPGLVYISHPTEYGTLYTKAELTALRASCGRYGLPIYLDGARLGYGLAAPASDLTLPDIAALCDAFTIGGTKVGALFGEALVFTHDRFTDGLFTVIKQSGALLAKGWLLGLQFDTLFTDELYLEISKNAIRHAETLKAALRQRGYQFYIDSPTNQIFVVLEDERLRALEGRVAYSFWEKPDAGHTVIRLATSWATTAEDVARLLEML